MKTKIFTTLSRRTLMALAGATGLTGLGAYATPARAQTAAPPLSAFGRLPAISEVALSPDGKRVAFVMTKNGQRLIYDYNLETGAASAAALEGDKIRELMWADNERVLVVVSMTAMYAGTRNEDWYGLILDIPNGKRAQLYTNIRNVVTSFVTGDFYRVKVEEEYRVTASGYILPGGVGTYENGGSLTASMNRCLFAFNPATTRGFKLDDDARAIQSWVVRPDSTIVGRSEYNDDTKEWTLRYKSDRGWREILKVDARYDMPVLTGSGRTAETVLVAFFSGPDKGKYVEYDAEGSRTVLDVDAALYSPIYHPGTLLLAGFQNSGPIDNWVFYDPAMKRLPVLVGQALPDSFNDILATSENPKQLVILSENSEDPGTYFYFDFTTGDYKEIGRAYPDIPPEWTSLKSHITYKAADGLEIGAWLTLPSDREAEKLALVVLPHGGPEAMDDARYDWMSQAIASRGYAVLQPNYRGSSGYGIEFTEKGYGEFGRKMQTDLSDGVAHLVKEGIVDPAKVAIAGASYGGYAALAGVTLQSDVYRCAVSIAGLSDLKGFLDYRLERTGFDRDSYTIEYWRRFWGADTPLDQISPVTFASKVSVPVMLIHGKDDVVVPFRQSQKMLDALQSAGKSVEMVVLREEDHWLSHEPTRVQTIEAMVGFLLKHNPPA